MCTLIVLHRCVVGRPLVVAANRDEFLNRPAEGPAVRLHAEGHSILAPLDLEAGGTWLGINAHGVLVGLTNLRPLNFEGESSGDSTDATQELDAGAIVNAGRKATGLKSRGEVVMRALGARSPREAKKRIEALEENAYSPFQLVLADAEEASLTVYRGRPETRPLPPGVHVVGNVEEERAQAGDLQEDEKPRVKKLGRLRERVEKLLRSPREDLLPPLAEICAEHLAEDESKQPNPLHAFESACVHLGDVYGTRSSILFELAGARGESRFWGTDGPPCENPFEDWSALLRELDGVPSRHPGQDHGQHPGQELGSSSASSFENIP